MAGVRTTGQMKMWVHVVYRRMKDAQAIGNQCGQHIIGRTICWRCWCPEKVYRLGLYKGFYRNRIIQSYPQVIQFVMITFGGQVYFQRIRIFICFATFDAFIAIFFCEIN